MSTSPTLRDLAQELGMSKSTVQRALTGTGRVSPETVEMVRAAAHRLNYKPDRLYSILGSQSRRRRSSLMTIAYLGRREYLERGSPSVGVDFFAGAQAHGLRLGYQVDRVEEAELKVGKRLMEVLYHRGYAGVLVGQMRTPDHAAILANRHLPVVCCQRIDPLPLHTVQPDIVEITRLAWTKMLEAGYRRIGAILFHHTPPCRDDSGRLAALLGCQQETVRPGERVPPFQAAFGEIPALLRWFWKHRPEAVMGFSPGQYYALQSDGVDMNQTGFATLHLAGNSIVAPEIAGISEPLEDIPVEAVNLLDRLIHYRQVGRPEKPLHILLPGRWHDGASLRPRPHRPPAAPNDGAIAGQVPRRAG